MRYYSIVISKNGKLVAPASGSIDSNATYTSYANGKTVPGAWNIEMDIPVTAFALPFGGSWVRVWGISLQEISQAQDLNGNDIQVFGGMKKGLPLADPSQSGLLAQGQIQQAFGNWIGTDMTLDLILMPSTGEPEAPKNIVLNWKKGTPLSDAIKSTLSTAFSGYTFDINISPKLILQSDEVGFYDTVGQFSSYVKQVSQDILKGNYPGVEITLDQKKFKAFDGTTQTSPREIAFKDLIGQPTWIESPLIQFKCVMRADLKVGDYVKLPPALATTTPQSLSQYRQKSAFQGTFQIQQIRHVGNFRDPSAEAWVTTVDAFPPAS